MAPAAQAARGAEPGLVDARRSDRSRRHRLQLRHRAGARRPRPAAAARQLRSAVHGHRRHRQSGDRALPIAHRAVARERARAELRVRPARTGQAAAQVRRPRRHAGAPPLGERRDARGRSEGAPAQLQQRAGVADRQRDRHRHERRSHQVSRAARQSLHPPDADLDARQRRRGASPRRGVVSRGQAVVERRLRADRRPRRQGRRSRRLGDAGQRQRHVVPEHEAAAGGRRSQSRSPGVGQGDG